MAVTQGVARWVKVCEAAELMIGIGVSALVRGKQIALFRTSERVVHAVGNRDPYSGHHNMSRGLVIARDDVTLIAAPAGHELFELGSGQSVDDPMTSLQTYPVRITNGFVEVCVTVRA